MNPPLWTKPSTTLASPDEDIPLSRYCASNLPDWEVRDTPIMSMGRTGEYSLRLLSSQTAFYFIGRACFRNFG